MEQRSIMLNNYFTFLRSKWIDVLRGPLIASIAYTISSVYQGTFSLLTAIALFNGMTVLLLITIFIVWLILKRKAKSLNK